MGCSVSTPDGQSWYFRWGHERGGNTCSLEEFAAWARVEFARPQQIKVFFNAPFDLRMLVYAAVFGPELFPGIEDAATSAALLNEHENSYTLDRLAQKYLGVSKDDSFLNEWCAAQFGGKPTREQAANYWRAPGNIVEPYACGDTDLTLQLYDLFRAQIRDQELEQIYRIETALIPIVVRMNLVGVRVDRKRAKEVKAEIGAQLDTARARWIEVASEVGVTMPDEWILPSTQQIVPVFEAWGIPYGRTEPSVRHPKGAPSITKEHLGASEEEPAKLVEQIRESTKLSGTFVDTMLKLADDLDIIHGEFHPLPVEYVQGKKYGTVSGRFSAKLLHQIPGDRNPKVGKQIRSLFIPYYDTGQWVKADYNQIEYRFMAHYAGGPVAEAYRTNPKVDFHDMVGELIGNPDLTRPNIKAVNFAELYGAGVKKGAQLAGVTVEKWKELKEIYHARTGGVIARLSQNVSGKANARGYIKTWGGRRCRYFTRQQAQQMGWKVHPEERHVGTYKALNSLLQGSAGDLTKYAMVRIANELVDWQNVILHLTVHDELDFTAPRGEAGETFKKRLAEAMTEWGAADGVMPLRVPIQVEVMGARDWGETVKEKKKKAAA